MCNGEEAAEDATVCIVVVQVVVVRERCKREIDRRQDSKSRPCQLATTANMPSEMV